MIKNLKISANEFNFNIPFDKITIIVGDNGSGKTTEH